MTMLMMIMMVMKMVVLLSTVDDGGRISIRCMMDIVLEVSLVMLETSGLLSSEDVLGPILRT